MLDLDSTVEKRETKLMMHEVADSIVKVTEFRRFGQAESYHGQDYRLGLREWTTTSTWVCTDSRVSSRQGGTSAPFVGC